MTHCCYKQDILNVSLLIFFISLTYLYIVISIVTMFYMRRLKGDSIFFFFFRFKKFKLCLKQYKTKTSLKFKQLLKYRKCNKYIYIYLTAGKTIYASSLDHVCWSGIINDFYFISIYIYIYIYASFYLFIYLFIYLSIYVFIYLIIYLFIISFKLLKLRWIYSAKRESFR